ncbi:hypothetical protein PHMEG_0006868 [Phytophthora megakarya]|uniref:Uncharacterized protein n=1 Tax=Phytophthora megakarya TaxID=4795 RepID=A0A225WMU6_9STRA|nr:hypothetical protein PHMEG_0006868 [Phytophthora megakarya]
MASCQRGQYFATAQELLIIRVDPRRFVSWNYPELVFELRAPTDRAWKICKVVEVLRRSITREAAAPFESHLMKRFCQIEADPTRGGCT